MQSNLQLGNTVHGHRAFAITGLPAMLVGANWVRAANSSKAYAGNPLVLFTLATAADVHVAVNNRAALPARLDASWTDIGESIAASEAGTERTFRLLRKRFGAGNVSLGPLGNGAICMYTVIVK